MANNYTMLTAEKTVPCTQEQFDKLQAALQACENNEECINTGIDMELYDECEVYIFGEYGADPDTLSDEFLGLLGKLLRAAGMEYLECGIAWTCDKMRMDSHGGTSIRFYPDGQLVWAETKFDYTPLEMLPRYQNWQQRQRDDIHSQHEEFPRSSWREEVDALDTQLGYWDWVWRQIESHADDED